MADIFISYSQKQMALTQTLASELAKAGYSVWWDKELSAGERFNEAIRERLDEAKAVIIIWTPESVKSKYVLMEAGIAYGWQKKLVTVHSSEFQKSDIPRPFSELNAVLVSDVAKVLDSLREHGLAPPSEENRALMRLDEVEPGLRAKFPAWQEKGNSQGLFVEVSKSGNLAIRSHVGSTPVNFGTVYSDATVYFGDFCKTNLALRNQDIVKDYLYSLSGMLPGSVVLENDKNITDLKQGSGSPKLLSLLERGDEWLKLICKTRNRLSEKVRSSIA